MLGRTELSKFILILLTLHVCLLNGADAGVEIVSDEVIVVAAGTTGCVPHYNPDAPLRAFVSSAGEIVAIAGHWQNRRLVGPELTELDLECSIIFESLDSGEPDVGRGRSWIAATWTNDGETIFALVHDEFQAHRFPGLCHFDSYIECWYNTVRLILSMDSAKSFEDLKKKVISPNFLQDRYQGRHRGYFNPSNIIMVDGELFTLVYTTGGNGQESGVCLFRANDSEHPTAWIAWDGTDFSSVLADPYTGEPKGALCKPVGEFSSQVGSVVQLRDRTFLAVSNMDIDGRAQFVTKTSADLINWNDADVLGNLPTMWSRNCNDVFRYGHPSILPATTLSNNFDQVDSTAYLFLTRFHVENCNLGSKRDLVRFELDIIY